MAQGTVTWYESDKGYGFVRSDDGSDVYVHYSQIVTDGHRVLEAGQRVLIVEDTATTGKALLESLPGVEELHCPIVAISLLLDRGGALGGLLADRGIPYVPVLGAPDLGYEFGS